MAYYHLYRVSIDTAVKTVDAGWHVVKIEEFSPKELEKTNMYAATGSYIHRYIIPDKLADQVWFRKGNESEDWENSVSNPLQQLATIKDNNLRNAWEIKFADGFEFKDYYVEQSCPEGLETIGLEIGEREVSKPKTIIMGKEVETMLSQFRTI